MPEATQYNSKVAHTIEPASSGRAKCRSCDQPIAKGELRLGERQPNAFGDGEMTLWFHLPCGAFSRPEPFLEAQSAAAAGAQIEPLATAARFGNRLYLVNARFTSPQTPETTFTGVAVPI